MFRKPIVQDDDSVYLELILERIASDRVSIHLLQKRYTIFRVLIVHLRLAADFETYSHCTYRTTEFSINSKICKT